MPHCGDDRDIGARLQGEMIVGLDVGERTRSIPARIDDDQLRALAQALLHARTEHGMGVGRIGADDDDHIGLVDRIEVLRAGGVPNA